MPAGIVHALHGERLWKRLEKEHRVQKEHLVKDAFEWGKQGPDFLFCHRFFPWQKGENLRELGGRLHSEPPEKTLRALAHCWEQENDPAVHSYILGFLCHYSLDRTCHPYIEDLSRTLLEKEPGQTEDIFHNEIESALDGIVLRWERGKLPPEFPLGTCFPKNEEVQAAIARVYGQVFQELFGLQGKEGEILQAEKDARFTFRMLTDRTGLKKQAVDRLERGKPRTISCHLRGIVENGEVDYANTFRQPWTDRQGNVRTEDFFQLFEEGEEDAYQLISAFPDGDWEPLVQGRFF